MKTITRLVIGVALVLGSLPFGDGAEAGNRLTQCGGSGQRHCCLFEFPVFDLNKGACDSGLRSILFGPGLGQGPAACSLGSCTTASFPTACGDQDERACTIFEHIPSCKSGLVELAFTCRKIDSAGFPTVCGDSTERPCTVLEHIPSCKSGLVESRGVCIGRDADGFPSNCGGSGEPGCVLTAHIPSCKPGLVEAPVPGTCTALDADQYPLTCGDRLEPACALATRVALATVGIDIGACKPDHAEAFGTCYLTDADGYPEACGANGERPCELDVQIAQGITSCKTGLIEHVHELTTIQGHRCGTGPETWPGAEVSRGGARTVLYIHGMNGHLRQLANADAYPLAHRLRFELPNVTQLYGADYNNDCRENACKQFVTLRALDLDGAGKPVLTPHVFGHTPFNALNFDIVTVARDIADGLLALPTEANITVIGHSLGGIVARQLVYRHYDELRRAGKRIAEVVTLGSPHEGGAVSIPEMPAGQTLQTAYSCGPFGNATLCALQRWQDWKVTRENGVVPYFGDHWVVDNTNYPQIRWIAAAANGTDFRFEDLFGSTFPQPLTDFISGLVDKHDSDGAVAVSSALGLALDACYPFTRTPAPSGGDEATVEAVTRTYSGVDYASALCHHPGAPMDPRYAARDELTGVGHSLQDDTDVQDFVLSSLSLPSSVSGGDLDLEPPVATGGVGTEQAVTATLTDPGGDPVFGIIIRFSVSSIAAGIVASGQCVTTAQGTCTFVYTGPATPDDHEITAFADGNANAVEDVGEPSATTSAQWRLAGGNLAVVRLQTPKAVRLRASQPAPKAMIRVTLQNRGGTSETIPDALTLADLVDLEVQSLGSCPAPTPVLRPTRGVFPLVVKPRRHLVLVYDVVLDCANDPAMTTKASPGHEDYAVRAAVDRLALDGQVDADEADDVCPRVPVAPRRDKGCGIERADGSFEAPRIDVVVR
jgi:pimeloyl-ACP methyl ester carboxylesterase